MNNYLQGNRNQGINVRSQNPRQEMEEEQTAASIFKSIEKQSLENGLKSQLFQIQFQIKDFAMKLNQFDFDAKIRSLKEKIKGMQNLIENDKSLDQESLLNYVIYLKENYLSREKDFRVHIKVFEDPNYFVPDNLHMFIKKISSYEISYSECQSLLFLDQELTNLEMIYCVLKPIVQNYKEILYYEKVDSPIKQYTKNRRTNQYPFSSQQITLLIGLLNKYYKFRALPNRQEKYVAYVKWTPDFNMNQAQYLEKLIIILEIPQEQNNITYALLNIFQQQNLKVCKSTSIPKQRNQLQQLSQQLGCNQFTATLVPECSLDFALTEFLKIVATKIDLKQLSQFLDENDYFIKEDKSESGRQEVNYFVDAFEMERLGFSIA
ncbi:unnamed protein product (macronuclear) [Paramecium tetraurelia]|uniref:Rho-GAP domain-containing protein n=1 Tax=Paramecium tetraurelia TaxID=5888 RepID=A0CCK7_PARTE|nr:uncharacterized protein GSPATT00037309001 [Paramecium tetraurelia]CAK68524.1 unnamed protein product [Paramecium tetraurelia]|eukprot:XP_001435921.1 hypothetical protein (macronuclear) [Paramecium tetraurelia strain d4-2]